MIPNYPLPKTTEFATEETFVRYINQTPLSQKAKHRLIGHEIAHSRAAQNLGYQTSFTVSESIVLYLYVCDACCTPVPEPTDFHFEIMLRAPRKLSPDDIKHLEALRK